MAKMAAILREYVRARKRDALRQACNITLGFDDRKGYKLVRYRIERQDKSLAATQGSGWEAIAEEGIIGIFQVLRGTSLDEFADDYAERCAREVMALIHRFCTPWEEAVDTQLASHISRQVRTIVADGALQKTARLLREDRMPNVILIMRDPMHYIRIACYNPIERNSLSATQHDRLFGAKGLIRKIQFSDKLQAQLEACQRIVLGHRGTQGGGVQAVMRHFSYAPQRCESESDPRRKLLCCIHAVALLVAESASDKRRKADERRGAEEFLREFMQGARLVEQGLLAAERRLLVASFPFRPAGRLRQRSLL